MTEQYVMANIRMPIRINADGTTYPFAEYITFELEECEKVDETMPHADIHSSFKESLSKIFMNKTNDVENTEEPEPPIKLYISQEELDTRPIKKSIKNTTFKNRSNNFTRRTARNYHSN